MPLRWRGGTMVRGLAVDEGNASTSTGPMERGESLAQHEQCEHNDGSEQESRRWSERTQRASHHLGEDFNAGTGKTLRRGKSPTLTRPRERGRVSSFRGGEGWGG